jgi:hypothetical protein
MNTKRYQNNEAVSHKALAQIRRDVEAIAREEQIRSQIATGDRINEDGIALDALEAEERELEGVLNELGRGDDREKIRSEAYRKFPVRKQET